MICLRTTDDWFEAHILRGLLEANDLVAFVLCEAVVRLDWRQAQALGGYRVCVPHCDVPAAQELLAAWQRGELADGADRRCIACGGTWFVQRRSDGRRVAFALMLVGLPLPTPFGPDRTACAECGTESDDPG